MQSAILFGLSNSPDSVSRQTTVDCLGGNCDWKPYLSLAICSTCADVTNLLVETIVNYTEEVHVPQSINFEMGNPGMAFEAGPVTSFGLPNGLYIEDNGAGASNYNVTLVSYGTKNRTASLTFQGNELLLWSLTVIRRHPLTFPSAFPDTFTATECSLSYCVKNYTSQIINGTLFESSYPLPWTISPMSWQPYNTSMPDPSPGTLAIDVAYMRIDLQIGGQYNISQVAINGIGASITSLFAAEASLNGTNATGFYMVGDGSQDQYSPNSMQPIYQSQDLDTTFSALAMSMTNSMRANDDNRTLVYGTSGITVYKVHWIWITLPLISVLGGCVFLALAIFYTRLYNLSIWKSSALSVLKCGPQTEDILKSEELVRGMEKKARNSFISIFETDKDMDGEFFYSVYCRSLLIRTDESTRGLRPADNLEMQTPPTLSLRHIDSEGSLGIYFEGHD